jgi:hypothetical protein
MTGGPWRTPPRPLIVAAKTQPVRPGMFARAVVALLGLVGIAVVFLVYLCGVHLGFWE